MYYASLSKKQAGYIRQLAQKKHRLHENAFVLEGRKNITSLLVSAYRIQFVAGTASFFLENEHLFSNLANAVPLFETTPKILSSLGSFVHNQDALAVVDIPPETTPVLPRSGMVLALEDIRDPGNLGTILRIADWYGLSTILCSHTTVELYNPKVLHASMGSFVRVQVHYVDLPLYLTQAHVPIVGATLDGTDVHHFAFPPSGILVIGNESKGIQSAIQQTLTATVSIPGSGNTDSLNAAVATAVLCDNWKRTLQQP